DSQLSDELRNIVTREALKAALTIKDPETQIKTLVKIIPHLPEDIQKEMWRLAIHRAWSIKNDSIKRDSVLALLFPLVHPDSLKSEILQHALEIESNSEKALLLTSLIPYLPEDIQKEMWRLAIHRAWSIKNDSIKRDSVLALLFPLVHPDSL